MIDFNATQLKTGIDSRNPQAPAAHTCILLTPVPGANAAVDQWQRIVVPAGVTLEGANVVRANLDISPLTFDGQVRSMLVAGILLGAFGPADPVACMWDHVSGRGAMVVRPEAYLGLHWDLTLTAPLNEHATVLCHLINAGIRLSKKRESLLLVLADWAEIGPYVVPHIYDPFSPAPGKLAPSLATDDGVQVLAKFARLDYPFHINPDGSIARLLNHITPPTTQNTEAPHLGVGSRHMTSLALTEATDAIALTVQASDGTIRLWCRGREALRVRCS